MKIRVTYITGEAPNLPWSTLSRMTKEEVEAYNNRFFRRETVELDEGSTDTTYSLCRGKR